MGSAGEGDEIGIEIEWLGIGSRAFGPSPSCGHAHGYLSAKGTLRGPQELKHFGSPFFSTSRPKWSRWQAFVT